MPTKYPMTQKKKYNNQSNEVQIKYLVKEEEQRKNNGYPKKEMGNN